MSALLPPPLPDHVVRELVSSEYSHIAFERNIFARASIACLLLSTIPPGLGWARLAPLIGTIFCAALAARAHSKAATWKPFHRAAIDGYLTATRAGNLLVLTNPRGASGAKQERLHLDADKLNIIERYMARSLPTARLIHEGTPPPSRRAT